MLSVLAGFAFTASQASAITVDPGRFSFNLNSGGPASEDLRIFFGDRGDGGVELFSYEIAFNEATSTASIFLNDVAGQIYAGDDFVGPDAAVVADVAIDLAFTWTGIEREGDSLVLREPTGGGAVASLTSDFFDTGVVQFALDPKGVGDNRGIYPATNENPLYFYIGPDGQEGFTEGDLFSFSAWVMAAGLVNINGTDFSISGDFHGTVNGLTLDAEVPEPATMLLLGSGVLAGAIKKRKKA